MIKPTLLIFVCESREHLLAETWNAFAPRFADFFSKRILAIDGPISQEVIRLIQPDLVVQNVERRGYIVSILNAISLVNTDYFFWLEEDWTFHPSLRLETALAELEKHPEWVQLRFSKETPLPPQDAFLAPGVRTSSAGFSANPCFCRTALIREGVAALLAGNRDARLNFESFLSRWYPEQGYVCAVVDPGQDPAITHSGFLESTPREWHMMASLQEKPTEYLPAFIHKNQSPAFLRYRIPMIFRLLLASLRLAWSQLFSLERYEVSMRVVHTEISTRRRSN